MEDKLLPLGSVVTLIGTNDKIVIIGRGPVEHIDNTEQFFDYVGCLYPQGVNPNQQIVFNKEDINRIIFTGYSDEEEIKLNKLYLEWTSTLNIPKGSIHYKKASSY
ncbi:DUF4176 domain-containing protein [Clostridium bornimense]|uniref:DUF4176 domain-containing protein n=1 Tax=Clostridium bornimense TaxID=1216932 RepID=UPI001C123D46|nr:DUF4176 domain-containing protein [Clostridium bornimense]MBU5317611.1 DUF4176 domain-containing protein [Clostridium bornimense]